jgi:spore maturation protein CgeB
MKQQGLNIVVLGLSLSSSWGNGHATTYRALLRSLAGRGHNILFLERNVPWYAAHRDLKKPEYCELRFYEDLAGLKKTADALRTADAVIVGSYVPQGAAVLDWVFYTARGTVAFYDIDTPVTLEALAQNSCEYLYAKQVPRLDLYLSFTGGPTLDVLRRKFGARCPRELYCSVDAEIYKAAKMRQRWSLGYLGTHSPDRQPAMERLIFEPAVRAPSLRFVVAGTQYPASIAWPSNVERIDHIPPDRHVEFYSSLGWALNLTRSDMRQAGYSPSVRLFEAAACCTPIISDDWQGLDTLFAPDRDIIIASAAEDVLAALTISKSLRRRIGQCGRKRILSRHTSAHRATELESLLMSSNSNEPQSRGARWKGENQCEGLSAS